jgi:hypothetical protein
MKQHVMVSVHSLQMFLPYFIVIAVKNRSRAANGCDHRAAEVDSALSETSPPPLRCIALLFAILRDGLVTYVRPDSD